MKTSSSKIITNGNSTLDIKPYSVSELMSGVEQAQQVMDKLYEKKSKLKAQQDFKSMGFNIDNHVKESYPDPQKEVAEFERRVNEEMEKRLAQIEKKAYEDGFQKAKDEGYNAGVERVKKEVEPFIEEMKTLLETFRRIREEIVMKNEQFFIRLVINIAEKILMTDYKADVNLIKEMIEGVVKLTGEREDIEVCLSKYDYERMGMYAKELQDKLSLKSGLRMEVDPSISRGGCKVITNLGLINATLNEQLIQLENDFLRRVPRAKTNFVEDKKENKESAPLKEEKSLSTEKKEAIKRPSQAPNTPRKIDVKPEEVARSVKERIKKDE